MYYPLHDLLYASPSFIKIPSKKEEKWRFSSLSHYLDKEYIKTSNTSQAPIYKEEKNTIEIHDGQVISSELPSYVHVKEHHIECSIQDNPFAKLASTSSSSPIELNIFEDVQLELYLSYSNDSFILSNFNIIVQEGINVCMHVYFQGGEKSFISHATHIKLENSSKLELIQIQDLSSQAVLISQECLHLHENSFMKNFSLLYQGEYLHNFIKADLHYKSDLDTRSLLLSSNNNKFIFSCDIKHLASESKSNVLSKQVLKDKSTSVFDANTTIFKQTQRTQAKQGSHALLLSESAQVHAKPHLEIYCDDLSASHGTTVGELNKEAISYLRSRGISEEKARAMLISAFIKETLEGISLEASKQKVLKILGDAYV